MNCYLSRNYKGTASAGNKAKTDIEAIMAAQGFRNVGLPQTTSSHTVYAFLRTLLGVLIAPFRLHQGDVLVLQYPLKKYFTFVCRMAHLRGAKVVTLIHDLGSFRRKALTEPQEIRRLNHADVIIAHNPRMKAWLEERNCTAVLTTLGIFDYLSSSQAPASRPLVKPYQVIYAGALSYRKNAFLYQFGPLARHYQINLYGNGFEWDKAEGKTRIQYMGFVKSDELIATAQGHFGLVWDGESTHTCSGNFGEYLQYNNPHKTSLYLRCGLPVIIWSKAALAPFIREHGVGLCVDSLEDLDDTLSRLSEADYLRMREKAQAIGAQLNAGHHTREALQKAVSLLSE
jgi:hypothetical protein